MSENQPSFYIASCVFTAKYPALSQKVQQYMKDHYHVQVVRCCTPKYKLAKYENLMPGIYRRAWCALPDSAAFEKGCKVYSICHNCTDILKETKPMIQVESVWEAVLADASFPYPNYRKKELAVQDCWRSYDNRAEQKAVRSLLEKMNIQPVELPNNFEKADFCGTTLYAPCIRRNAVLAPHRFVENAAGKFIPHSEEEQHSLMQAYCRQLPIQDIVTYCHYCQAGLELGGANTVHLASLLFEPEKHSCL